MNLIDGPANQRKALALNEKQLAANHCNELFVSQVGATRFEPLNSADLELLIFITSRPIRARENQPTAALC